MIHTIGWYKVMQSLFLKLEILSSAVLHIINWVILFTTLNLWYTVWQYEIVLYENQCTIFFHNFSAMGWNIEPKLFYWSWLSCYTLGVTMISPCQTYSCPAYPFSLQETQSCCTVPVTEKRWRLDLLQTNSMRLPNSQSRVNQILQLPSAAWRVFFS